MSTAAPPTEPLVTVDDIHTFYGKSHILHGVSLVVGRGEVVGLLGRNGVGKSTTLKTIMGLVNPRRGKVVYEGRVVTGLPAHRLARIGIAYVPEDRRIFRLLTVMENLRTGFVWQTFMKNPEAERGFQRAGFTSYEVDYRPEQLKLESLTTKLG